VCSLTAQPLEQIQRQTHTRRLRLYERPR
jgi:hypothetical protein